MDIGTAKATARERAMCPHHMIDIIEPDEDFSVADYTDLAHKVIADIRDRGKIPIMCGGTGLYIDSVVNDIELTIQNSLDREVTSVYIGELAMDKLKGLDEVAYV